MDCVIYCPYKIRRARPRGGLRRCFKMLIKKIGAHAYPQATSLIWTVFLRYNAPDFLPQGIEAFRSSISDWSYINALELWGAYIGGELVGVIALRRGSGHIALLFVDGRYHRQGIGRALFETARRYGAGRTMTVNASPYAVGAYLRLGFVPTAPEQHADGIRYTPMAYSKPPQIG